MVRDAPNAELWRELTLRQCGVVSREQAMAAGWTTDQVQRNRRGGHWRRLHPGTYATFTGPLSWQAQLWAALLHAGDGAVASHRTAGRLQGLVDVEPVPLELLVPWGRTVSPRPGITTRSSRHIDARRHPARSVPQTRVEETVLDLVELSLTSDDVVAWLARACQRRTTSSDRLLESVHRRPRLRHRRLVLEALGAVSSGVASPLEHRYRRDVEQAHGLPRASRGERIAVGGRHWYADVRYPSHRVRVELEELEWHRAEDRWRDRIRDNAAVLYGDVVLRYDWRAVAGRPCVTAAEVARVLQARGWPNAPQLCSPTCRAA